jgi:hypothetical protein
MPHEGLRKTVGYILSMPAIVIVMSMIGYYVGEEKSILTGMIEIGATAYACLEYLKVVKEFAFMDSLLFN